MDEKGEAPAEEAGAAPDQVYPDPLPRSYGELQSFIEKQGEINPFELRLVAIDRIQSETKRPLLCYATQTSNVLQGAPVSIDDGDLVGFSDLVDSVDGNRADVFLVSNGGSAEATERIVRRLRGRFEELRFLVPSNAYSAATLMCLAGDKVLMLPEGTLGPIDPQLNGVPARAIIRGSKDWKNDWRRRAQRRLPPMFRCCKNTTSIFSNNAEVPRNYRKNWRESG